MKLFKKTQWFTLIELLITIAIITILFWAANQLDFNRIGNNERIQIFNTKILSHYETIRNNALLWKWIDTTIEVPDKWKIEYSITGSWVINSQYSTGSWIDFNEYTPNIPEKYSIENIACFDLDGNVADNNWPQAEIIFDWNDISLNGTCLTSARILQFETHFLGHVQTFRINVLNGTMDIK